MRACRHNPRSAPGPTVQRFMIGDGDQGTADTIAKIRELVREGMTDPIVNQTAIAIIRSAQVQQFDFVGEAHALYTWVLSNFRFVRDVFGVETLRRVSNILRTRAGDCDDINAILLPSLLMTVGAHVRLVTVATDPQEPKTFTHIYCEVECPDGSWLVLDAARRNPAFGKGPGHVFRKRVWSLLDNSFADVHCDPAYANLRNMTYSGFAPPRGRMQGLAGYLALGDDSTDDSSDDGFDWSGLAQVIGATGTATANIIRSTTGQTLTTGYVRNPATGQLVPVSATPQGTLIASSVPGGVAVASTGTFPTWLLYAGFGLAAFMLLRH